MNRPNLNKEITNKEKFLWILLGSIIDFLANIIYAYNWLDNENDYLTYWPTNIIILCLFSFLLLKIKLYKLHYLSVGIMIIFGTADNFIFGYFDKDKIKQNYKGYIIYFFTEITFSSLCVFYKFIMLNKFIKSFIILSFQGLVITTKYFKDFDNFFSYIEGLSSSEIALFFGLILVNFLTYLTIYIIIDIFTPFHIFLLNIITDILLLLIESDSYGKIHISIIYIVFLIIIIFLILVYIEIIQLNFCGLSTMTKINIQKRARLDSLSNNDNDDEEDNKEVDKNEEEKRLSIQGYSIELQNVNNKIIELIGLSSVILFLNFICTF